jgi:hypothetical protein
MKKTLLDTTRSAFFSDNTCQAYYVNLTPQRCYVFLQEILRPGGIRINELVADVMPLPPRRHFSFDKAPCIFLPA